MSPNGWTDDFLCTEWFEKCFIPQATACRVSDAPILLIYDGHGSHNTTPLIELAREHNIILFCLPPHTTHKLQPLDVGVFGPFARAWLDRCDEYADDHGEEMPREDFIKEYMAIRAATFKPQTILSAFRKCGICPLDRQVFSDEDFAPSIATSTTATHVPPSFPVPAIPKFSEPNDQCCCACSHDDDSKSESESDDESQGNERHEHTCQRNEAQDHYLPTTTTASTSSTSSTSADSLGPEGIKPMDPSLFYRSTSPRRPPRPRSLKKRVGQLEHENKRLRTERNEACAHGAILFHEFASLKRKMNAKSNQPKKKRKLNTNARFLSSEEGLAEAKEADRLRAEKEKKKQDAAMKRAAEEVVRLQNRLTLDPDMPFTGALSSKNKTQLQNVAFTLHLPIGNKLTKEQLTSSINEHFDKNPTLKTSPRYEQIFNSRRRAAPPPPSAPQPLASSSQHNVLQPNSNAVNLPTVSHSGAPSPYSMPTPTTNLPYHPTYHAQPAYQPTPPLHFPAAYFQPQIDPILHSA